MVKNTMKEVYEIEPPACLRVSSEFIIATGARLNILKTIKKPCFNDLIMRSYDGCQRIARRWSEGVIFMEQI